MTERPILFSAPMVRALLAGTKTQTRRVIKRPLKHPGWTSYAYFGPSVNDPACRSQVIECGPDYPDAEDDVVMCPYGSPGDRLWVREPFLGWYNTADRSFSHVAAFAADGYELEAGEKWQPSIHMPRAASRITLNVVGVRVERLQEITEADARAEGMPADVANSPRVWYMATWDAINGPGSWDANPWVWVVEFRRAA